MFDNIFQSFHDTVAQAKEEREQLDRLLTVSTPRERLLLAGVALVLVVLAGWSFFGSVPHSFAVNGVVVAPDESGREGGPVQALVWLRSDAARDIDMGMPAVVELGTAGGAPATLSGEVEGIAAMPMSSEPTPFEPPAPVALYRVDIVLDEGPAPVPLEGRECRIVLDLGTRSPIALFGPLFGKRRP